MFGKVLVANRGEIAVRIIRTLREMGITSVAAFSDADRDALFVQEADESYRLGPAPAAESYLNVPALVDVARMSGAQAVHPGYGFLSENAGFAESVTDAGLTFIGPPAAAISLMGDKVRARQAVTRLDVPVVPGTDGPIRSLDDARAFGRAHGYPLAVKAAGGGGGRGIRVVHAEENLEAALEGASREALTYFKNADVYLERYFEAPRHVEVQVLGDRHGRLIHLGERDCSVQRRHQKLIEEAPSPAVDRHLRERVGELALRAAESAAYTSAGTVEFLLTAEGDVFFLEMNTRIQVEHPVTELVADIDLIRSMVLIAAGEPLPRDTSLLDPRGHAIEIRVNAEDPAAGFRPTPAALSQYREPGGIGVRVDSGVYQGFTIPSAYDSLMSKLIVWAPDREQSRRRALRAIAEYRIGGPSSTLPFSARVLDSEAFVAGRVDTTYVERHQEELTGADPAEPASEPDPGFTRSEERTFDVEVNRRLFQVKVVERREPAGNARPRAAPRGRRRGARSGDGPDLMSPMHGTIVVIRQAVGDVVQEGDPLFVIEAMKMENEVRAHRSGRLAAVAAEVGTTVEAGQLLARIEG